MSGNISGGESECHRLLVLQQRREQERAARAHAVPHHNDRVVFIKNGLELRREVGLVMRIEGHAGGI